MTQRAHTTPAQSRAGLTIAPGTTPHPTVRQATPKKKKAAPEAAIQRKIIKALEQRGAIVTRVNAGFLRDAAGNVFAGASAGTSDLLCCYRGRYLALEVKAPGGRLTDKQSRFLTKVRAAGGIATMVQSVNEALAVLAVIDAGQQ